MVERRRIWLVTVVETWGSAPRVPGALLCLCEDGAIVGSVSGGCVEDDLVERLRTTAPITRPTLLTYGVTRGEATRFGLPCGGTLRLVQEPLQGEAWVDEVLARASQHELIARRLDASPGVCCHPRTHPSSRPSIPHARSQTNAIDERCRRPEDLTHPPRRISHAIDRACRTNRRLSPPPPDPRRLGPGRRRTGGDRLGKRRAARHQTGNEYVVRSA